MYESDSVEVLFLRILPLAEWEPARQRHAGEYVSVPSLSTYYVAFDVRRPPFDDPRVRRAFALATDREALADVTLRGFVFPASGGFVPPGMPGHSPGIGLRYDPEQARLLLTEAGYPGGQGFPEVELLSGDTPPVVSTVENLRTQWLHNLGVKVTSKRLSWGEFLDRLSREVPSLWYMGGSADYPDPDSFLRATEWRLTGGWHDDVYDSLVEDAPRVLDQEERMNMYEKADRILVDQAPILPLYYWRFHMLVKPWVRRYPTSPTGMWFWKDVIIEPH
jgi:oligopeptide transport system substrate-binding protein